MKKPVVLIIENSTHITGALKSIVRTSEDLNEYYKFVFVLPRHSQARTWVESKGFHVHELPMIELSRRPRSLLMYFPVLLWNTFRLRKIIRKERASIVHNNDLYNLLPVTLAFMGMKIPYINHIRFLPEKFPAWLFNYWLRLHIKYAHAIICVSGHLRKQLPALDKIKMIYNELPATEKHEKSLPAGNTILYLSNVIRGKGQNFAIKAFAKIAPLHPSWKLRFVGGDMGMEKNKKFKEELKAAIQYYQIESQIEWSDFSDDVESEYKKAAFAINFSESESFSITCLEAQFFGCPIIATRSGGPAEIIVDGQTGFLVPVGDIKTMVEAMQKLIDDHPLRVTFAAHGKVHVREKFSVQNTSYQLKTQYDLIKDSFIPLLTNDV
jgi:glycosyltransferase involved in cell wall biosynthesis